MNIPSKKEMIEDFKTLSNNPFIPKQHLLILFYDDNLNCIRPGWCSPDEFGNDENIIELKVVKSRCTKLTDKEYHKYIETLKLQIKQHKIQKSLDKIKEDFV